MICEIVNPSDPYTLKTEDFVLAGVAVAFLGNGKMGLTGPNDESTPILFGWDDWFREQGIQDLGAYLRENGPAIADVLDSVLIGPRRHREDVEAMLRELPEERRRSWLVERQDRHRSSMNDIGTYAWKLAAQLREAHAKREGGGA